MIDYTVKRSVKAVHMRITITSDAEVVVTIPERMNLERAERFIKAKSEWIEEKVALMKKRTEKQSGFMMPKGTKKELEDQRGRALALIEERLAYFNTVYGFTWKKITIKNLKSRWGSCSKAGNLNFSYKIVYLPKELADYLVVHELCHLGQFNHSKNFWKLVEKTIPEYEALRKQLRGTY